MSNKFRVATLNIWNRMGLWEDRLISIREGIRQLDADLIGLQEVLCASQGVPNQLAEIAADFNYFTAYAAAWYAGDIGFGNAILSRWPIVHSARLELPNAGTDEARCVLFGKIHSPYGIIPLFVTHLNYKLDQGYVREEQVSALVDYVQSNTLTAMFPALLVGDFNAVAESNEIRFLKGLCSLKNKSTYFFDAFDVAHPNEKGCTFTRDNPNTAPMHEPDRRIDYIFVRGPDDWSRGEVINANICFNMPVSGIFASDHFGVYADLQVKRFE